MRNFTASASDNTSELRIRLFRILGTGGVIVSLIAGAVNFILGLPLLNTLLCWGAALLALSLLTYAARSGKYRLSMMFTIVLIFFLVFTGLFFAGGGYEGGMPLYFILAVVFTAFMLEGPQMPVFVLAEICWYCFLCLIAYRHPETVHPFTDKRKILTDILIALPVVSAALSAAMYLQLQLNHRKQEELDRARQEALSASEAKTSFLANISHDIRTPLNTVVSMNELIAERTVSDDIRGWTDKIRISCHILLALIDDILDISRIESGRMQLPEAPYLTAQLLKESEAIWKDTAKRNGLSFRLEAEESLPSVLIGNADSIRKIINNLVGNAIKYTDRGAVTLRFLREDTAPTEADRLNASDAAASIVFRIEVEDTGIGIAPADLEKVFLPFERGASRSSGSYEGTGLGLAIVKDLTEEMQGAVRCESTPGKGSCFTVRIPQKVQDMAPVGQRSDWSSVSNQAEPFTSILAPDVRVLVVDDNEFNRQVMCDLLKPTLIRTDDVESGTEALEMLEIREYDLIFMDIMMPEMDGREALRRIREEHPEDDTPVVALTADALAGTREKLISEGFADYLAKPVSMREIGELLMRHLGERVRLVRDPSFRKLPEEQQAELSEKLLFFHIHLEDALELDGGSVDNLRMRAEHFLNYKEELTGLTGAASPGGKNEEGFPLEALFHFAHSMKSTAKGIGARDLSELAAYMERHRDEEALILLILPVLEAEYDMAAQGEHQLLEALKDV